MPIDYHFQELEIALDPFNPKRAQPPISPKHKRILDVGCGMGQTLLAAGLPSDVEAFGVDLDQEAIETGQRLAPSNIHLQVSPGDRLPFADGTFDFVFCRVALPLMPIARTLAEMQRVLRPGGDLWLMLHNLSFNLEMLRTAIRHLDFGKVLGRSYVLASGALFNILGWQLSLFGRHETFQTPGGIRRALERTGFGDIVVEQSPHLTASAQKLGLRPYEDEPHQVLGSVR
jgi:ubiquinone/menaquinone biosynthesis C-methylase UbiE